MTGLDGGAIGIDGTFTGLVSTAVGVLETDFMEYFSAHSLT